MKAIGLNFADIMLRKGDYPMRGHAPAILISGGFTKYQKPFCE